MQIVSSKRYHGAQDITSGGHSPRDCMNESVNFGKVKNNASIKISMYHWKNQKVLWLVPYCRHVKIYLWFWKHSCWCLCGLNNICHQHYIIFWLSQFAVFCNCPMWRQVNRSCAWVKHLHWCQVFKMQSRLYHAAISSFSGLTISTVALRQQQNYGEKEKKDALTLSLFTVLACA